MATTKNSKPHSSARKKTSATKTKSARAKKAASKRSGPAAKTKKPKKKNTERPAWLKRRDELTLKIFQWAYESNQRGEFQRL